MSPEHLDRPAPAGPPPACQAARKRIPRFLDGSLNRRQGRGLRSHMAECAPCREHYFHWLSSAARLGKALERPAPPWRMRAEAREGQNGAVAAGGNAGGGVAGRVAPLGSKRRGLFQLRVLLGSALLFFLMAELSKQSAQSPAAHIQWIEGTVDARGTALGPLQPSADLSRGDWCATGERARADIRAAETVLRLEGGSEVLVEDPVRARFRLQRGSVSVEGTCVLTSPFGVIELEDGAARVRLERGGLELSCQRGEIRLVNHLGQSLLRPGDTAQADLVGWTRANGS